MPTYLRPLTGRHDFAVELARWFFTEVTSKLERSSRGRPAPLTMSATVSDGSTLAKAGDGEAYQVE